jgi:hypothetical protein
VPRYEQVSHIAVCSHDDLITLGAACCDQGRYVSVQYAVTYRGTCCMVMRACTVLLFYPNHFCLCALPYVYYYLCNSTPQVAGHRNSSKNYVHAEVTERPGVQGWALKATSSRETRQLRANHLYLQPKGTYTPTESSPIQSSQTHKDASVTLA